MIDEVVLLRHGRTSYNLVHRLQGQVDVPLDIVGQWQADQSGLELARRYYGAKVANIARHPDLLPQPGPNAAKRSDIQEYDEAPAARRAVKVVSSDLFRAAQTAHAFADILGLPVELDPRLRERDFGQWEGKTRDEIREMDAQAYASWKQGQGGEQAYGVESRSHVGARGARTLQEMVAAEESSETHTTLVAVSHGSFIAATVETLLGLDPEADALGTIKNAFWSSLEVRRASGVVSWRLSQFNLGPNIATLTDWDNGPDELRNPHMPSATPLLF